jgi:hypothetical protein
MRKVFLQAMEIYVRQQITVAFNQLEQQVLSTAETWNLWCLVCKARKQFLEYSEAGQCSAHRPACLPNCPSTRLPTAENFPRAVSHVEPPRRGLLPARIPDGGSLSQHVWHPQLSEPHLRLTRSLSEALPPPCTRGRRLRLLVSNPCY